MPPPITSIKFIFHVTKDFNRHFSSIDVSNLHVYCVLSKTMSTEDIFDSKLSHDIHLVIPVYHKKQSLQFPSMSSEYKCLKGQLPQNVSSLLNTAGFMALYIKQMATRVLALQL